MNQALPDSNANSSAAQPIVNISCYKFVPLDDLQQLRSAISERAKQLDLRGTVLLSPEGINLFVAGTQQAIDSFVEFLRSDERLGDLEPKESRNDYQPFNRMLVKIKKEIIAFGIDSVNPSQKTSPKLPPRQLQQWLNEGRRVHLLDVRNDYEYQIGTFDGAINMHLDHFREFPEAIAELPEEIKEEPVVMFCTGGIRCEKAGPFMEQAGFQQVYQLDGGILKYFETVGGDHYHGECFVFDQRVAVDPSLEETDTTQCYVCQAVVTAEEQQSADYKPGEFCPHCVVSEDEAMQRRLQQRQTQLDAVVKPLPGSIPYLNCRPLNVPQRFDGCELLDFLDEWHPQVGRGEWQRRVAEGLVAPHTRNRRRKRRSRQPESLPLSPHRRVRGGERLDHLIPGTREPDVNPAIEFLYEDDDLLVINKPAPLPMHPCGRFNRNSLRYILNQIYHPERPHIVHRLDANTSGVLLLCRRKSVARVIQSRFEQQAVKKVYLARVHRIPQDSEFDCHERISDRPGADGIRLPAADGLSASTHFRLLSSFADGTALIEARPATGRTNQIRLHLWQLGHPIVGDPTYLPRHELGSNRTLQPEESAMCLHASRIQLTDHNGTERLFESPEPDWIPESNA
jgi:UPF0176 protein